MTYIQKLARQINQSYRQSVAGNLSPAPCAARGGPRWYRLLIKRRVLKQNEVQESRHLASRDPIQDNTEQIRGNQSQLSAKSIRLPVQTQTLPTMD